MLHRNKTVAIVQARMSSHRFPGKMMEKLEDAPLIEWVLRRTKLAILVDDVILATSDRRLDDPLTDVAQSLGIQSFRGDENDVLRRLSNAARLSGAETTVRICADRPLVDPDIVDLAIKTYFSKKPDLSFNHISDENEYWPRGFGAEVLSSQFLYWMDDNVTDPSHREHVTLYAWDNRSSYAIIPAKCPPQLDPGEPDVRFDVDWPEDLEKLRRYCQGQSMDILAETVIRRWREEHGKIQLSARR